MPTAARHAITIAAASCFILSTTVPLLTDLHLPGFETDKAWAGNGNRGGNGGGNSGGGGNSNNGHAAAGNGGGNGFGPSTSPSPNGTAGGFFRALFGGSTGGAQQSSHPAGAHPAPKAAVRQYVVDNDLKQGEVARVLKSWNSLNRNPQAFLNNMDNPNSLLGLQAAYVLQNMTAQTALAVYVGFGGVAGSPPTPAEYAAAQALLAGDTSLLSPEAILAAQLIANQYNAWMAYQTAEAAALDAFKAASVSYSGTYDGAIWTELRKLVDGIVAERELAAQLAGFVAAPAP